MAIPASQSGVVGRSFSRLSRISTAQTSQDCDASAVDVRIGIAAGTLGFQPLLNAVSPEFAAEQRTVLQNGATSALNGFTGGDDEFAGMGWEFRSGYTLFNLLTAIPATAEMSEALKVARAARLGSKVIAAENAAQMSAVGALRVNQSTAEAVEAAAALTGPAKVSCRRARPNLIIDLVEGPDGVLVPASELKNQRLLAAPPERVLLPLPKGNGLPITDSSRLLSVPRGLRNPDLPGGPIFGLELPAGFRFHQAVAPGQATPGAYGAITPIPDLDFVRNNLAIIPEFKRVVSGSRIVEVIRPVRAQLSVIGPQMQDGVLYRGGEWQIRILEYDPKNPFVNFIGSEIPLH